MMCRFVKLMVWLCVLGWGMAAYAQSLKPRILVIFDTSGSMGIDVNTGLETGGDNSEDYPGNGGTSRLAVAKDVMSGIIQTTSEAQFALMRYPQSEGLDLNPGTFGGDLYEGLAQNPLNYAGSCTGTVNPDGDSAFSLIAPFAEDNEGDLLQWMDNRESWPMDRELRASGPTPIVETLRLAREYIALVLQADADVRCREYAIVVLTDGSESCVPAANRIDELTRQTRTFNSIPINAPGGRVDKTVRVFVLGFDVNQRAINQLETVALEGNTGSVYSGGDPASLQAAFSRILTEAIPVEVCNGEDDDCDTRVDEGVLNRCGQCGADPMEICNGLDEDCDDLIDEGVLNSCGQCGPRPQEICNNADDDCDGVVDEAVQNACGGCAAVRTEACNNVDDDCDGQVDNIPGSADPLQRSCSTDTGQCSRGVEFCRGGTWRDCNGQLPAEEDCNRLDDDCDGFLDEVTRPCGPALEIGNIGECQIGRRRCDAERCEFEPELCSEDGFLTECLAAMGPEEEVCDGRDNDCDGDSDEGLFNACDRCGPPPPEACNGLDDNCDGRIDDNATCPQGYLCFGGNCTLPCNEGECERDFLCVNAYPGAGFCHPEPCAAVICAPGTQCDENSGNCTNPCNGVQCEEGEGCDLGECVPATCRHDGCEQGENCIGDTCVPDPCSGVECADNEFCREGLCIPACQRQQCGHGRACRDGECVEDPCDGICIRGTICDPSDGACVADPCSGVHCPSGMACVEGDCRADAPCVAIVCPQGTYCTDGFCTDFTPGLDPRLVPRLDAGIEPPQPSRDAAFDAQSPVDMDVMDAAFDADPDMGDNDATSGPPAMLTDPKDTGCSCRSSSPSVSPFTLLTGLFFLVFCGPRRRRTDGHRWP